MPIYGPNAIVVLKIQDNIFVLLAVRSGSLSDRGPQTLSESLLDWIQYTDLYIGQRCTLSMFYKGHSIRDTSLISWENMGQGRDYNKGQEKVTIADFFVLEKF